MKKYPHYKLYFWNESAMQRINQKEYGTPEEALKDFRQWNEIGHNSEGQSFLAYYTSPYESHLHELV